MEYRKLTLDEFLEEKKKYFTTEGNEKTVVKCFSTSGYQFWTKCKTIEDIAKIYWKHEPLLKRYFDSEDEVIAQLKKSNPDGIAGCALRWLPGNMADSEEVCLQPYIYRKPTAAEEIEEWFKTSMSDKMFGMLMDPYTYTGKFKGYKDDDNIDSDDEADEFINKEDMLNPKNYCVFVTEITVDEYLKQEQEYVDSVNYKVFDDGLIKLCGRDVEISVLFDEILKNNVQWFDDAYNKEK